jgi:hypothetical protein
MKSKIIRVVPLLTVITCFLGIVLFFTYLGLSLRVYWPIFIVWLLLFVSLLSGITSIIFIKFKCYANNNIIVNKAVLYLSTIMSFLFLLYSILNPLLTRMVYRH